MFPYNSVTLNRTAASLSDCNPAPQKSFTAISISITITLTPSPCYNLLPCCYTPDITKEAQVVSQYTKRSRIVFGVWHEERMEHRQDVPAHKGYNHNSTRMSLLNTSTIWVPAGLVLVTLPHGEKKKKRFGSSCNKDLFLSQSTYLLITSSNPRPGILFLRHNQK